MSARITVTELRMAARYLEVHGRSNPPMMATRRASIVGPNLGIRHASNVEAHGSMRLDSRRTDVWTGTGHPVWPSHASPTHASNVDTQGLFVLEVRWTGVDGRTRTGSFALTCGPNGREAHNSSRVLTRPSWTATDMQRLASTRLQRICPWSRINTSVEVHAGSPTATHIQTLWAASARTTDARKHDHWTCALRPFGDPLGGQHTRVGGPLGARQAHLGRATGLLWSWAGRTTDLRNTPAGLTPDVPCTGLGGVSGASRMHVGRATRRSWASSVQVTDVKAPRPTDASGARNGRGKATCVGQTWTRMSCATWTRGVLRV